MEFPQTIWLDIYVGSRSPRLFKVSRRILDLNPTAGCHLLLLPGQAEHVRIWDIPIGRHFGLFVGVALLRRRNGAPENVGILGRNLLEIGDAETEILSDNLNGGVDEPVGKHESGSGGIEVTVGKDHDEIEAIIQGLDAMREVRGESLGNLVTVAKILVSCGSRKYVWVRTVSWAFDIADIRPPLVIQSCNPTGTCK